MAALNMRQNLSSIQSQTINKIRPGGETVAIGLQLGVVPNIVFFPSGRGHGRDPEHGRPLPVGLLPHQPRGQAAAGRATRILLARHHRGGVRVRGHLRG